MRRKLPDYGIQRSENSRIDQLVCLIKVGASAQDVVCFEAKFETGRYSLGKGNDKDGGKGPDDTDTGMADGLGGGVTAEFLGLADVAAEADQNEGEDQNSQDEGEADDNN